jgi:hypothetical protein
VSPVRSSTRLVAKFTSPTGGNPAFLTSGHTAITNQTAIHFLKYHHRDPARALLSTNRFCLVSVFVTPVVWCGIAQWGIAFNENDRIKSDHLGIT